MDSIRNNPVRMVMKLLLFIALGAIACGFAGIAVNPFGGFVTAMAAPTDGTSATPSAPAVGGQAGPVRARSGTIVYPANPLPQVPQILYPAQGNLLADPNAGTAANSKMPRSTSRIEATQVIEAPEKAIPLLGPVIRESARTARALRPVLMCTIEVLEHGALVSRQTMGCSQSDDDQRVTMLMEFGQEVPNEMPNMKYWLSVQVDGYQRGYPILRTRMEMKGLLGRTVGRRKYESVTLGEPNKKHTAIAFNIDDDDFAVTIFVRK